MENNTFKVINEDGREIVCDILFTFDSEETNKSYMVYTDNSKDEQGNIQVFASIYDPSEDPSQGVTRLEPIESEREWKIIDSILGALQEKIRETVSPEESAE